MNWIEFILLGDVIFGFIVAGMQIWAAMRRGEHRMVDTDRMVDTSVNPLDYLVGSMPEGTYSANQPFKKAFAWFGSIVGLLGFGWVAVNVPAMRDVATIYGVFGVAAMVVILVEEVAPRRSEITACMLWGYGEWDKQILLGFAIALPFIAVEILFSSLRFGVMQVQDMPLASLIVTALMIPVIEEGFFRGVLAPSIAEDAGIIHGAIISSFVFTVFHAYVYHLSLPALVVVFVFGAVAGFVDLVYKSILPSATAHKLVNLYAFMCWYFQTVPLS